MGDRSEDLRTRRLSDRALRERGQLPLSLLLEVTVPLERLRAIAHELNVAPKGFRVEKAPASALAPALAECKEPKDLDRVVALLLEARMEGIAHPSPATDEPKPNAAEPSEATQALRFQEQEGKRLQGELERARASALRAVERESSLRRTTELQAEELQQLRGELARLRDRATMSAPAAASGAERELASRVHELELEIEARNTADDALRRQLASDRSRMRVLESEIEELEALLPKGRKRKAPPPEPEPDKRCYVPYFLPSFYKSLIGKERKSVERAVQAVFLFCTEGHAYPGLEVKQLGGQDTWSMRASLGLRVYFTKRADGDIEVSELADREDQHTTLRRLKER